MMYKQPRSIKILLLFAFASLSIAVSAQSHTDMYTTKAGAINGYDVVAYFAEGKPVKGIDTYQYHWQDADWKFSSQANLDSFKANPEKYAPQYGGYCAYGCSEGHKSPTQPDAWTIVNNKLYLNYNKDVKSAWIKDTTARIQKADSNWIKLKGKE